MSYRLIRFDQIYEVHNCLLHQIQCARKTVDECVKLYTLTLESSHFTFILHSLPHAVTSFLKKSKSLCRRMLTIYLIK